MSLENIDQYKGKWIAILDEKIIAEGIELSTVYKKAIEKSKGKTPLFEQIPKNRSQQTLLL